MADEIAGKFYVVLEPVKHLYDPSKVKSLRATKLSQKKPSTPAGHFAICINIKVPRTLVEEWLPTADIFVSGPGAMPPTVWVEGEEDDR